jgi:hypothetical protein
MASLGVADRHRMASESPFAPINIAGPDHFDYQQRRAEQHRFVDAETRDDPAGDART